MRTLFLFIISFSIFFASTLTAEVSKDPLSASIDEYYASERSHGAWYMGGGAFSLVSGISLSSNSGDYQKGMGTVFLGAGLYQGISGYFMYSDAPKKAAETKNKVAAGRKKFKEEELDRLYNIRQSFGIHKSVELGAIGLGLLANYMGSQQDNQRLSGMGAGLVAQGLIMVLLDAIGERRLDKYGDAIYNIQVTYRNPTPSMEGLYGLSYSFRF
ncbi:MAG: hypothetical protein H7A24_00665 [Leptospiraceae bacterium]|nr:hypothetical protein [Leptospiraceae bacterium]MCP5510365.1 hypothetical protein [Leptospiraceae bacterium]